MRKEISNAACAEENNLKIEDIRNRLAEILSILDSCSDFSIPAVLVYEALIEVDQISNGN